MIYSSKKVYVKKPQDLAGRCIGAIHYFLFYFKVQGGAIYDNVWAFAVLVTNPSTRNVHKS